MKNIFLISFIVIIQPFAFGQIDIDLIKNNVTENPTDNYFPLLEIFKINPSKLTQGELNQLYYGSKFIRPSDSKVKFDENFEKRKSFLEKIFQKKKFSRIKFLQKKIRNSPKSSFFLQKDN